MRVETIILLVDVFSITIKIKKDLDRKKDIIIREGDSEI